MPPAFALSQDQTLKFITAIQAKTRNNRSEQIPYSSPIPQPARGRPGNHSKNTAYYCVSLTKYVNTASQTENQTKRTGPTPSFQYRKSCTAIPSTKAPSMTVGRRQRIPSKPDSHVNEQNQTDRFTTPHKVTNQPIKPATQQQAEEAKITPGALQGLEGPGRCGGRASRGRAAPCQHDDRPLELTPPRSQWDRGQCAKAADISMELVVGVCTSGIHGQCP